MKRAMRVVASMGGEALRSGAGSDASGSASTTAPSQRVLWIVNQAYWPDVAATGQLLADLAEDAAAAGFDVRVLTSRVPYASASGRPRLPREVRHGVSIRRVAGPGGGTGLLSRALGYGWFLLAACGHLLRARRGDLVLVLSTPPFVALAGRIAKRRGARFVYKVEDLYPDVAVALGLLRPGRIERALARLSAFLLRGADRVVVLDAAMKAKVSRLRGGDEGIEVIPNWADGDAIRPMPVAQSRVRAALGVVPGDLVLLYAGNFGRAHEFGALIAALRSAWAEGLPIRTLFSGGGAQAPMIRAAADELPSITCRSYVPRDDLADLLAVGDVHIVSLRPEVEGLLWPSKVAGALAAGRPLVVLSPETSSLAAEVRNERLGWTVPHDAERILGVLRDLVARRTELPEIGRRGRALFDRRYARVEACRRWVRLLESVVSGATREGR